MHSPSLRSVRSTLLLVSALCLLSTSCAMLQSVMDMAPGGQAQSKVLVPSQVHPGFSVLDESNPLAASDSRVEYLETGMASFDAFFLESRRLEGALALSRHTLDLLEGVMDTEWIGQVFSDGALSSAVGSEVSLSASDRSTLVAALLRGDTSAVSGILPGVDNAATLVQSLGEDAQTVLQLATLVPAMVAALGDVPGSSAGLIDQGQALVTSAPGEFAGPQALMVPQVVSELRSSVEMLAGLPAETAELLGRLRAVIPGI